MFRGGSAGAGGWRSNNSIHGVAVEKIATRTMARAMGYMHAGICAPSHQNIMFATTALSSLHKDISCFERGGEVRTLKYDQTRPEAITGDASRERCISYVLPAHARAFAERGGIPPRGVRDSSTLDRPYAEITLTATIAQDPIPLLYIPVIWWLPGSPCARRSP